MAATDYARGRPIAVRPVPKEITWFSLAKEFGWLPSQIEKEDYENMRGLMHVLSTYNSIRNQEIEQANRKARNRR